ncbi:hypothetical protein F5B19DRAFT_492689 [Rostrohypoxylon terebratum]|nr:hypothetical protein F5B19DRAFT_492689 [Rostrohypoxylon terebratum]
MPRRRPNPSTKQPPSLATTRARANAPSGSQAAEASSSQAAPVARRSLRRGPQVNLSEVEPRAERAADDQSDSEVEPVHHEVSCNRCLWHLVRWKINKKEPNKIQECLVSPRASTKCDYCQVSGHDCLKLDGSLAEDARELYAEIRSERPSHRRVALLQYRCLEEVQQRKEFIGQSVPQRAGYDARKGEERAERTLAAQESIAENLGEAKLSLTLLSREHRHIAGSLGALLEQTTRLADAQSATVESLASLRQVFAGPSQQLPAANSNLLGSSTTTERSAGRRDGLLSPNWVAPSAHRRRPSTTLRLAGNELEAEAEAPSRPPPQVEPRFNPLPPVPSKL